MERLWISVSEEELKKEIEEDGPDGYEADSTGRRPGWVKLLSYYIHTGQASMDMDISMDIHVKSVDMDMDMDMDGKFYIHGNPGN